MSARTRPRSAPRGVTLAAASVIALGVVLTGALTGCSAHAGRASATAGATTAGAPHYQTLADAVLKSASVPGVVDGTDGQGDVLVRLDPSVAGQAAAQLRTEAYGDGYGLFDTSGKQLVWAAPSPVADAYDVHLTTAGLFVQREGDAWDLSRVDPKTGAVLWTFNEAPGGSGTHSDELYSYDTFWGDSGSGGDLVVLEHDYRDQGGARDYHHELTALDAQTGQRLFAIPSEDPSHPSYQASHQVKVLSFAPFITATADGSRWSGAQSRDPKTGAVLADLDAAWFPQTALESTGTAFVTSVADGTSKTKVIARDAKGKTLWSRVVDTPRGAVVAADAGHILVRAGLDDPLFALDATSGKPEGAYASPVGSTLSAFPARLVAPDLMTVSSSKTAAVYLVPTPGAKKPGAKKK